MAARTANEWEIVMSAQQAAKPARDTGVGAGQVGNFSVILLTLAFLAMTILLLVVVWSLWPPTPEPNDAGELEAVTKWGPLNWNVEQNMLLLMALLGATGAMGYVLRSFSRYVGERSLVWSWVPLYFLTPALAAIVSTATYIVLRGGLLGTPTGSTTGTQTLGNTWGFAAVAILVGLFAAQATSKLKEVFEALFTTQKPGGEAAPTKTSETKTSDTKTSETGGGGTAGGGTSVAITTSGAAITEIPETARVGDTIVIKGTGLKGVDKVTFGGGATGDATFDDDLDALTAKVPGLAEDGPLSVTVGAETVTSTTIFRVTR